VARQAPGNDKVTVDVIDLDITRKRPLQLLMRMTTLTMMMLLLLLLLLARHSDDLKHMSDKLPCVYALSARPVSNCVFSISFD